MPKRVCCKHGMSRTRLYRTYQGMKRRCYNQNCCIFNKYGGKGIKMCDEWTGPNGFENFAKWALSHGYRDNLTIDRIDATKGYCPENCRWATYEEQNTHLATPKSNTSGIVGVSWSKKENKWLAMISINDHAKRIGSFKTKEEAAEARNIFIKENGLPHQLSVLKQKGGSDAEKRSI